MRPADFVTILVMKKASLALIKPGQYLEVLTPSAMH